MKKLSEKVDKLKNDQKKKVDELDMFKLTIEESLNSSLSGSSIENLFNKKTDEIGKQVEQVENRTQKLLDAANNGMEKLIKVNKTLPGKKDYNIKLLKNLEFYHFFNFRFYN